MIGTRNRSTVKESKSGLFAPVRNRFFHGKKLDAYHFDLETAYGIEMRRMINRHVIGRGVVCGLDVTPGEKGCSIVIGSGFAIDGLGREIVVPAPSQAIVVPKAVIERACAKPEEPEGNDPKQQRSAKYRQERENYRDSEDGWLTISICYHECEIGGTTASSGPCSATTLSTAGLIRESYRVEFAPGRPESASKLFSGLIYNEGTLSQEELAKVVTQGCCEPGCDLCITLAGLHLACAEGDCAIEADQIDITVRPVVITNPLLYGVGCFESEAEPEENAKVS